MSRWDSLQPLPKNVFGTPENARWEEDLRKAQEEQRRLNPRFRILACTQDFSLTFLQVAPAPVIG
jgi:hypothetical protein